MNVKTEKVMGFEVLDSRGKPTVAAFVELSDGSKGFAISPSGASTGKHEATELRDNDPIYYFGKGVKKAVNNINTLIAPKLENIPADLKTADRIMIDLDNTINKSKLGANAILAVSMAMSKALSSSQKMPLYRFLGGEAANTLPTPMMNILNGGAHSKNTVDIQEFMVVPIGFKTFEEKVRAGSEIYTKLGELLNCDGLSTAVGDEGGYAPDLKRSEDALDYICEAIIRAGYTSNEVKIALDIASSEWFVKENDYFLPKSRISYSGDELISYIKNLVNTYPIISVEDGAGEDDFETWKKLSDELDSEIMLVGDDLFVTNKERLLMGMEMNIANSILVKLNQIGTVSETLDVISLAVSGGYTPIISHRSGESEDTFISDLCVAVNSPFIKAGAPCRSDRTAKYNRLLIIEKEI